MNAIDLGTGEARYDPWGLGVDESKLYYSLAYWVSRYFRPVIHGVENIPAGRVLIVPNHSGQLPFDGLVVAVACLLHAKPPRVVRAMGERWFPTLPFVNIAFSRPTAFHIAHRLPARQFRIPMVVVRCVRTSPSDILR